MAVTKQPGRRTTTKGGNPKAVSHAKHIASGNQQRPGLLAQHPDFMDEQHDHRLHAIFVEKITGIHIVPNVKILVPNYLEVSVQALPKI